MPKLIEYQKGQNLGECIYLYDVPRKSKYRRIALFKCRCGKGFITEIDNIKSGNTTSCGCRKMEILKYGGIKHNLSKHPLFQVWCGIKKRCYNPNGPSYKYYGGRGISMCDEWLNDFKSFYDHVIKLPYYSKGGMTLDRADNNGDYEPKNMRWATRSTQSINRRKQIRNKSGFIGVHYHKLTKKWQSYITIYNKRIYLGLYDTPIKAKDARNKYITENGLIEYSLQ